MESYVQENYRNLTYYTVNEWFGNMTLCMESLRDVENQMKNILALYATTLANRSRDSLIAYTVSTVVVVLIAAIVGLIFSKTIQGPWRKLLMLQEDMVYKFVPREFMSIINKEKVTDLHHGDFYEKELDVMFVDIRNYTGLSERLSADELFKFLNKYLALVGPIIRRNFGYIDKYMGKYRLSNIQNIPCYYR